MRQGKFFKEEVKNYDVLDIDEIHTTDLIPDENFDQ